LLASGLITAVVAFVILALEQRGHRRFELAIAGLLGIVLLGFAYDLAAVGAAPKSIALGLTPRFVDSASVLIAAGIVGATVMPHVVYLHSALTKRRVVCRDDSERRELLRFQRLDVLVALGIAGGINLAMMFVAASVFHHGSGGASGSASGGGASGGAGRGDSLLTAHADLARLAGGGAALAFAVALLASGLSSSCVGTYAGQVVMQGFIGRRIPLFVRRGLTMLPALIVLGVGLPVTDTLIVSQVLLSIGIPFALVPLAMVTRRTDIMGSLVNRLRTTAAMFCIAATITLLNLFLVYDLLI
jgi:manganese transport protein